MDDMDWVKFSIVVGAVSFAVSSLATAFQLAGGPPHRKVAIGFLGLAAALFAVLYVIVPASGVLKVDSSHLHKLTRLNASIKNC